MFRRWPSVWIGFLETRVHPSNAGGSLVVFFLEDPNAVAANGHGNAHHRFEQFDRDLFLRLVNLHDAGLLAFERSRDEFDDIALHDPAHDRSRRQVGLNLVVRNPRRLAFAFYLASGTTQAPTNLFEP